MPTIYRPSERMSSQRWPSLGRIPGCSAEIPYLSRPASLSVDIKNLHTGLAKVRGSKLFHFL